MVRNYTNKTYMWSMGTTGFRQADLPFKIEIATRVMRDLWNDFPNGKWKDYQNELLDRLMQEDIIQRLGRLSKKDARAIASTLEQLGLVSPDKRLTKVGNELLRLSTTKTKSGMTHLRVNQYDDLYALQIMKMNSKIGKYNNIVHPFWIIVRALVKFDVLDQNEFLLLMMTSDQSFARTARLIKKYRKIQNRFKRENYIKGIVYRWVLNLPGQNKAYIDFVENDVLADNEIRYLVMHGNSVQYAEPFEQLYLAIKKYRNNNGRPKFEYIYNLIKDNDIWRVELFGRHRSVKQKQQKFDSKLKEFKSMTDLDFRKWFFRFLHTAKALALFNDYSDQNRRFLSLTTFFETSDTRIDLALFQKALFSLSLSRVMTTLRNSDLYVLDSDLTIFNKAFDLDLNQFFAFLTQKIGRPVSKDNVDRILQDLRNERFANIVKERFNEQTVIKILELIRDQYLKAPGTSVKQFEQDKEKASKTMHKMVAQDADTPTTFEFIATVAWYILSEKNFNPLEAMQLYLDGNLLPRTHAGGGHGDVLIKYRNYKPVSPYIPIPNHDLYLELTLNQDGNQRRNEMEPVSRHLGEHKVKIHKQGKSHDAYSVYIAHQIDKNTEIHFRSQKWTPYFYDNLYSWNNEIIPITIDNLIFALINKIRYTQLYTLFKRAYNRPNTELIGWREKYVSDSLS